MKKNIVFVIFAAAAVLAACNKEAAQTPVQGGVTGRQTVVASINESKAVDGQGFATFKAGELIDIFYSDMSKESVTLTAAMISEDGKTATFEILGTTAENLAVYPGVGLTSSKWTAGDGPKYALGNRPNGLASGKIASGKLVLSHVCSIISFSANEIPAGFTFAYLVAKSHEAVIPSQVQFNFATGATTGSNPIKYAFTNKLTDKSDIRVTVFPGDYFKDGFVLAFATAYGGTNEVVGKRLFVNKPLSVGQGQFIRLGNIDNNTVVLGTEAYRTVTLDDGNVWMAENMRFIPDGKEPSSTPGDGAGVWYPYTSDGATATAKTDAASIAAMGYLYDYKTLLGKDITADNLGSFEGCQGICPPGWHVPTRAEYFALCGNSTYSKYLNEPTGTKTDPTACFYDAAYSAGTVGKFNDAGFNFPLTGTIALNVYNLLIIDSSVCSVEAYYGKARMTYLATSSPNSATQFFGMMTTFTSTNNKGKVSLSYVTLDKGAVALRCVKNK